MLRQCQQDDIQHPHKLLLHKYLLGTRQHQPDCGRRKRRGGPQRELGSLSPHALIIPYAIAVWFNIAYKCYKRLRLPPGHSQCLYCCASPMHARLPVLNSPRKVLWSFVNCWTRLDRSRTTCSSAQMRRIAYRLHCHYTHAKRQVGSGIRLRPGRFGYRTQAGIILPPSSPQPSPLEAGSQLHAGSHRTSAQPFIWPPTYLSSH